MKIFFRSAPLLHLMREGEERAKDRRLLGITGGGGAGGYGINIPDFWKSPGIIVLEPG